ncbi:unnamed protein product [Orchesella dallaii]|uniref:C2H2-type domain-containing protein n=1 Tax=Orchesella dallaii TaxID=48710 RepID=A0ABP1SAT1_9HEXA
MDRNMFSRCLFCATNLAHNHPVRDHSGGVKLIKNDNRLVFVTASHQKHILKFPGDFAIQQQLQTCFILRNILKISKETVCRLLVDHENYFSSFGADSDLWTEVQVCPPCGELVFQYYQAEKKPRLETALTRIRNKLKEKMEESKDVEGPTPGSIWGRIRNYVLREEDGESEHEGSPAPHQVIIKVEMVDSNFEPEDDEEEWDLPNICVKTEMEDTETDYEPHSVANANPSSNLRRWEPPPCPAPPFNFAPLKPKTKRLPKFGYICANCPYKNINSPSNYEAHIKVHFEGSPAAPCAECGVFVFPNMLKQHRRNHRRKETRKKNLPRPPPVPHPDPPPLRDSFASEYQSGVLNLTEKIVKTEVIDLGHFTETSNFLPEDEEVEESEPIPIYQPPFYLSLFDEEEETQPETSFNLEHEHQYRPSQTPTQTKPRKRRQRPSSNPNYTIFINRPKTSTGSRRAYQCVHCPYTSCTIKSGIEDHIQLHEPGSRAIPCPECGMFVLPERLTRHKGFSHPQIRSRVTRRQMKELTKQPSRRPTKPHIHPDYRKVKVKQGFCKKAPKFTCNHCHYRTVHAANIKTHIELHEEGSTAIPCDKCGWFVLPEHMQLHNEHNHSKRNADLDRKASPTLHKCSLCPFESKWKQIYEDHQILHKEGSRASQCPECGCYTRQPLFNHRKGALCVKLRKRKTMKEARISQNQNVKEQNGS